MRIRNFIQSDYGKIIISIILGFGLSTLFRKTCADKNCMKFMGPPLNKIKGQTFEQDDKCYQFNPKSVTCSSAKKIVRFA